MKSKRANFDRAAKEEMWERAKGHCEICGLPFNGRTPHYHHTPVPAALMTRKATAQDGKCICQPCHKIETERETIQLVSKAKRLEAKRAGIQRQKVKIPNRPFPKSAGEQAKPGEVGNKLYRAYLSGPKRVPRPWFLK